METKINTIKTNQFLLDHVKLRRDVYLRKPKEIYPWWIQSCEVKILLLTNSFLNFGAGDFGLSAFVNILMKETRSYVHFKITLAHRGEVVGIPGVDVHRSIPQFRFTDMDHFREDMYDQVWLFGADGSGRNNAGLSRREEAILSAFMNAGGGVFATGDHGVLGKELCGNVARVRKMRLWDNASGRVGMSDPQRNDTNQQGHDAGTQFDDQSDDIPQRIEPKMYQRALRSSYAEVFPHPLLCSTDGVIRVLPDHPHEGECVEPINLLGNYHDGTPEFPGETIAPEIIATSSIPAGNDSSGRKAPTQAGSFGAICAYDGHKAGVGRVVTDATWHHFVNVNLIGEINDFEDNRGNGEHPSKILGFLASPAGEAHLKMIKHYFINIAVWISPPPRHRCFTSRRIWQLVNQHRVLEATMNHPSLKLKEISNSLLFEIGSHARDVLGKTASHCGRTFTIIDLIRPEYPELGKLIDPWNGPQQVEEKRLPPWVNPEPLFAMALGAGLLAVRDAFPLDEINGNADKIADDILPVLQKGARAGLKRGVEALTEQQRAVNGLFKAGTKKSRKRTSNKKTGGKKK